MSHSKIVQPMGSLRRDRLPAKRTFASKIRSASGVLFGVGAALSLSTAEAFALEEVGLAYGGFQFGTLSVSDLETFSESGQLSPNLEGLLRLVKLDEAAALRLLTTEVAIDGELLADASRTFVGESFFQLVGTSIQLPNAAEPSWTYLRDALVVAATDDNQVNALEVLQEFGADSVIVDTDKVGQVIAQIQQDTSIIEAFFDQGFLNAPEQ